MTIATWGLLVVSAPCFANTAATTVIEASDPAVQYIGRFVDDARTGGKMFDMPGCEIRARLQLAAPATVKVTLAQRHLSKPDPACPRQQRQQRLRGECVPSFRRCGALVPQEAATTIGPTSLGGSPLSVVDV